MTCTKEHAMQTDSSLVDGQGNGVGKAGSTAGDDLGTQCLRILRCTARALASSPGGLRFKAGTRPWLDGLSNAWPAGAAASSRRTPGVLQAIGDQGIRALQA